jgi:phosphotransferase system enzyme I (PtsP)
LHPSVLRAIKTTIDHADKAEKEILICGEMAGSHIYAPILVGLGARNLSMNVRAISRVRNVIRSISSAKARELSASLLLCDSAVDAERTLLQFYSEHWPSIFSENFMANTMLARGTKAN